MEFDRTEKLLIEKVDFTVEQLRKNKISLMTDLDGTRVRSAILAVDYFNRENKTAYTERDLAAHWAMVKWAEELGMESPREYAIDLWNSDDVMINANPVQGAVELSRFLHTHRNSKIDIPVVTARPAVTRNATEIWHTKWMPWSNIRGLLYMQLRGSVNPEFKTAALKANAPTYYFEDQTHDAESIVKAVPDTKVILVSQPWNEDYAVPEEFSGRIIKPDFSPGQSKALTAFYAMVMDYCG